MPSDEPRSTAIAATLLDVHRRQWTGVVRFESGAGKKQLALREGRLAYAESTAPDDHLVRILVRMKLLPRSSMQAVSQSMKEGLTADQAVVRAAQLGIPELLRGLREQALAISASILLLEQPEIRLYPGSQSLGKQVSLDEPLPQMLVLAARRAASEHPLPNSLSPSNGLLVPAVVPSDGRDVIPLDPVEAYAFSLVRGPTPVEEVLALIPPGDIKPSRVLSCLLLLGMLQLETSPAGAGSGPVAAPDSVLSEVDELLERFEASSFYGILSVAKDATEQEIKSAYHDLARKYHPDRFQAAGYSPEFRARVGRLFTYINQAYSTLGDPASRDAYDAGASTKDSQLDAAIKARSSIDMEQEKIADSLYRAGRLALARKDFEKAVAHLKECVWLRPDFAKYHHYLGVAQSEIPRWRKDAETHLQRALELDSTSLESHLELGKLYLKVRLPKRAAAQFEQVLRWDSGHAEAQRLLAGIKQ